MKLTAFEQYNQELKSENVTATYGSIIAWHLLYVRLIGLEIDYIRQAFCTSTQYSLQGNARTEEEYCSTTFGDKVVAKSESKHSNATLTESAMLQADKLQVAKYIQYLRSK